MPTSCYESLVSINLAKVTKESKKFWLVAKFGPEKMAAKRENYGNRCSRKPNGYTAEGNPV